MSLPPHPKPVWPTEDVTEALTADYDFTLFSSWQTLFNLSQQHGRRFYIRQFLRGQPVSRYEVAHVAPEEEHEDPVILFNAGGLFGDDAGNLGGSLILRFTPPIQRQIIDTYEFGEPEIK